MRGAGPDLPGRGAIGERRGGFVLALVVLMLFAISVAGAAGYLVVSTEFNMAKQAGEGAEAVSVARAGLHRYAAEQLGVLGDSVSYAIGNGVALVTRRRVAQKDSVTDVYYLRSEGTVFDVFSPATPARGVVGAYAVHHRRPLSNHAAFMVSATAAYAEVYMGSAGLISGNDASTDPSCPGSGVPPIASVTGAIARTTTGAISGGTLQGTPTGEAWSGGFAQMYDSVGLRWDVLSDPTFLVDFEDVTPDFAALPADSFPVVRWNGDFTQAWSGRGVLIVNGMLDVPSGFTWDGIVLAGSMDDIHEGRVRGMLVAGLDGPNPQTPVYWRGTIQYYSCLVRAANESISYLELLENTVFEAT